jgi:hypothetical protein
MIGVSRERSSRNYLTIEAHDKSELDPKPYLC